MRKSNFSESQIVATLKKQIAGYRLPMFSGTTALVTPRSISGGPNMVAWKLMNSNGSKSWNNSLLCLRRSWLTSPLCTRTI